jgi:hypothetical protein
VLVRISYLMVIAGEARPAQIADVIAWARVHRESPAQMGPAERARLIMPRKILPRILAVTPGEQPMTLHVRWDKGEESLIDVSGMIQSFRVYGPLRQSPELFRQVRVGEHGTDVVWTDEIDMAADTLARLAQEQAGETMTPDAFRHLARAQSLYAGRGGARQPAHGRVLRAGRSPDPACRRIGNPSAGYGFYLIVGFMAWAKSVPNICGPRDCPRLSNPNIIVGRALTPRVTRIEHPAWFDQH